MVDALFIVPGNAQGVYQKLSEDYSAIETPTWALLLAESWHKIFNNPLYHQWVLNSFG